MTTTFAELTAGDQLPPLTIDVTARLIVAGAIASRDFQDVHHDKQAAIVSGAPDIFMNILTSNGLAARFVTDWAGPRARLRAVAIRLGVPVRPGHQLEFHGWVEALDPPSRTATVAVHGTNILGEHVTGTVTVQWS
jgi:MaoC like domain